MRFLQFNDITPAFRSRKSQPKLTKVIEVRNSAGNVVLGTIKWNTAWLRYCFYVEIETCLDCDVLKAIEDQIRQLTTERKRMRGETSLV